MAEKKSVCINLFDIAFRSLWDGPGSRVVVYFQSCSARCSWCHSPHSQESVSPLLFAETLCTLCGRCIAACPNSVHSFQNKKHHLDRALCHSCGLCIQACPGSSEYRSAGVLRLPTGRRDVYELFSFLKPHFRLTPGITLSGGEALLQQEGARALLTLCKEHGVHTAVETSGLLAPKFYQGLDCLVDTWLFGMRFTTDYGKNDFSERVASSYCVIGSTGSEVLLRVPVVPGHTDTIWYLTKCTEFMSTHGFDRVFLSPWNRDTGHYYSLSGRSFPRNLPSESRALISEESMKAFFLERGYMPVSMKEYDILAIK